MRVGAALLVVACLLTAASAEEPVAAARTLLANWHQDGARIERARALLESAAAAQPTPEVFLELSRAWFLTGDFHSASTADKAAAYERGREAARRAIALAPNNDQAHLWLALNTGRFAEIGGKMNGLKMLGAIRESSDTVLRLNPRNVDGLTLAGGILAQVPRLMGGDRTKAETYFLKALEIDPHSTSTRMELAELYMDTRRWAEARRQLQQVLDEHAATDLPRWTVNDLPRARTLLTQVAMHEPRPAAPPQSP